MRISVLGSSGSIGQFLSLLLKIYLPKNSQIFLYDINPITPGLAADLNHVYNEVEVYGYSGEKNIHLALQDIDIVLISAGIARKIGMDRSDLLKFNINTMDYLVTKIAQNSPNALIGIITNPINTIVPFVSKKLKKLGIDCKNKLFGITKLDTIRASYFVSKTKKNNIKKEKIVVPVIGGHSNLTIVPLFSQIQPKIYFDKNELIKLTNLVQNAGDDIIKIKKNNGSSTLSMGYAAASFTISLIKALQGYNDIIEYAYVESDNKYAKFISQPMLLGKNGIIKYLDIGKISNFEKKILNLALKKLEFDIELGENILINKI